MAHLDPPSDPSIPAVLAEDAASLEKKDPIPVDDDDSDSAHEGLEFPSEEELATLPRVSDSLPWAAYSERSLISTHLFRPSVVVIAVVELAERFSVSTQSSSENEL